VDRTHLPSVGDERCFELGCENPGSVLGGGFLDFLTECILSGRDSVP